MDTEEETDTCESCGNTADASGCDIVGLDDDGKHCTSCLNSCDACGEWYKYYLRGIKYA